MAKIWIDEGIAFIEVTGMRYLKMKTEISKRFGNAVKANKDVIEIPASLLSSIQDLIGEPIILDESVKVYLNKFSLHERARIKALEIVEDGGNDGVPTEWVQILDPAQASAVSAMILPDILGLCLFDEQGSGKTVMTISSFDILKQNGMVDAMIVVCPKSMISEWPKDIIRFTESKYKIVLAEGDRKQKYDAAFRNFDVLVTNYEGIEIMQSSLIGASGKQKFLLVVDESYYLKNGESVRSENIGRLRLYCERCFVLCGTPAPNSAHDLVNQFDLADLGYTFGGFKKSNDVKNDFAKIAELIELRGLFIRRLKPEILQHVPEKNFHIIAVDLEGKQKKMYSIAKKELEMELKTLTNETFKKKLATYFQRRSALLQICSCPQAIDPTFSEVAVKYKPLDRLLAELIGQKRKVIIWSFYKRSLDEVETRYKMYNPVRVDGSVSTTKRRTAVKAFQEDPNTMLFIGNPAAAGAGITLHASYDAIYLSYSNQAAHYLQSLDRIHRRGQESNEVNYYLIVCKGTIEETEVVRLRGKEVKQHDLLGDHIPWPTSLDDALNELIGHA